MCSCQSMKALRRKNHAVEHEARNISFKPWRWRRLRPTLDWKGRGNFCHWCVTRSCPGPPTAWRASSNLLRSSPIQQLCDYDGLNSAKVVRGASNSDRGRFTGIRHFQIQVQVVYNRLKKRLIGNKWKKMFRLPKRSFFRGRRFQLELRKS